MKRIKNKRTARNGIRSNHLGCKVKHSPAKGSGKVALSEIFEIALAMIVTTYPECSPTVYLDRYLVTFEREIKAILTAFSKLKLTHGFRSEPANPSPGEPKQLFTFGGF